MQRRSVLATILVLLLAAAVAAAYFLLTIEQRADALIDTEGVTSARLDGIADLVVGIGVAQQGYVAPGQLDEPWFERSTGLFAKLDQELASVAAMLRAPNAGARIAELRNSVAALLAADQQVRDHLAQGQDLMAADVLFSDGRNILDRLSADVHGLRRAETGATRMALAALGRERWTLLAALSAVWLIGAIALTWTASSRPARPVFDEDVLKIQPPRPTAPVTATPGVDLTGTANLCTDLSRVTDTAGLANLLGRAAELVGASGVTLWLGAGDQLFAALGHGYSQETLARLGPLRRDAENAVVRAWRTARPETVAEKAPDAGAVIMPMFAPGGCIGVLALEMRLGNSVGRNTLDVAAVIAAQVATAVAAWPSASPAKSPRDSTEARVG